MQKKSSDLLNYIFQSTNREFYTVKLRCETKGTAKISLTEVKCQVW